MIYIEARPSPPLRSILRSLWYTAAPRLPHQRERVLPNGTIQIVISLAADSLTDCGADSGEESLNVTRPLPGAILTGARSRYDIIHTRDMAELMGVIFRPGGLGPWLRQPAGDFFEQSVPLDALWNIHDLRDRLRSAATPQQKLATLDRLLTASLKGREISRRPAVKAALMTLRSSTVSETAASLGLSPRRLHQLFTEDAGLSPKLWSRIDRFQRAVSALRSGQQLRWEQLALDCGYYDQSHFSNDFRAFSGIDPTTYSAHRGRWQNHVALD